METRTKAVRALGLITANARARQFAETALMDPKPEVQAAAAEAFGQMGAKASVAKLVIAAKSQDTSLVFAS